VKKQLSEMSLEELWKLFPVILKEHNTQYKAWYAVEEKQLLDTLGPEAIIRINHIGSSAVEGLVSKPTVDILLEIDGGVLVDGLIEPLTAIGWGLMRREDNPIKLIFNKGYTPTGFAPKVYHLHVRYAGDWSELYFKDFLMAHPDTAEEYGRLKMRLQKKLEHDRDAYTEAKTEFIVKYSKAAKQEYGNRYKLR
jgi:GrpB-like predicted nucleotidyltransferase (UPF0157 family)